MVIAGCIENIAEWLVKAGPVKGKAQWKEGYSALEFAKKTLQNDFELDIKNNILNKISENQKLWFSFPEFKTQLDNYGEPRHHDLVIFCENNQEKVLLCFEAKVKENFDDYLHEKWEKGNKTGSHYHQRINNILQKIINKNYIPETMENIRYQLLTGTMGTIKLSEEYNIKKCVFCIYQMYKYDNEIVAMHEKEINDYIKIFGLNKNIAMESLVGPIIIEKDIEFYLSYIKRKI
jgi:hypothetical protein